MAKTMEKSSYSMYDTDSAEWKQYSFETMAESVIFSDGRNAEEKLGNLDEKVNEEIQSIKTSFQDGCSTIASAITAMGVTTANNASPTTMATNIKMIELMDKKIRYLGTGTSFDVSSYDGYKNFTVDNFYIQPAESISTSNWGYGTDTGHNIGQLGIKSLTSSIVFSYDASKGVLTAHLAASAYGGVNNSPNTMKTASGSAKVKAYLITKAPETVTKGSVSESYTVAKTGKAIIFYTVTFSNNEGATHNGNSGYYDFTVNGTAVDSNGGYWADDTNPHSYNNSWTGDVVKGQVIKLATRVGGWYGVANKRIDYVII